MPEEQQPELNPSAPPKHRGRRRGHRGGRGRRRDSRPTDVSSATAETIAPQSPKEIQTTVPVESGSAIAKAADEVRQIVESLEQALEQMEEVLELVETAERQKFADEREIESLRRALRRIHPSRGEQARDAGD